MCCLWNAIDLLILFSAHLWRNIETSAAKSHWLIMKTSKTQQNLTHDPKPLSCQTKKKTNQHGLDLHCYVNTRWSVNFILQLWINRESLLSIFARLWYVSLQKHIKEFLKLRKPFNNVLVMVNFVYLGYYIKTICLKESESSWIAGFWGETVLLYFFTPKVNFPHTHPLCITGPAQHNRWLSLFSSVPESRPGSFSAVFHKKGWRREGDRDKRRMGRGTGSSGWC